MSRRSLCFPLKYYENSRLLDFHKKIYDNGIMSGFLSIIAGWCVRFYDGFVHYIKTRPRSANLILALLLFAIFFSGLKVLRERDSSDLFAPVSRSDFDDYYQAARRLSVGEDPYLSDLKKKFGDAKQNRNRFQDTDVLRILREEAGSYGSYLYPPLTASLLMPLSYFSYETAAIVFQCLSIFALGLYLFYLYRSAGGAVWQFHLPVILSLILLYLFFEGNSANGNIGFFLILLCGSGLILSDHERETFRFLGGVLIGVAVMIKVTPIFFGLLFLARRGYAAMAGVVVGIGFGFLLPAAILGWDKNLELFQAWYDLIIKNFGQKSIIRPWANNQTISGAVGKLFFPFSDRDQSDFGLPFFFSDRLPSRDEMAVMANIVKGLNLFLYFALFFQSLFLFVRSGWHRQKALLYTNTGFVRLIFVVILVSLVASGVSWYHAYSLLFIPIYFRMHQRYVAGERFAAGEKFYLGALLFFGFLYAALPGEVKKGLSLFSVFTWLSLSALFMISALIFSGDKIEAEGKVIEL